MGEAFELLEEKGWFAEIQKLYDEKKLNGRPYKIDISSDMDAIHAVLGLESCTSESFCCFKCPAPRTSNDCGPARNFVDPDLCAQAPGYLRQPFLRTENEDIHICLLHTSQGLARVAMRLTTEVVGVLDDMYTGQLYRDSLKEWHRRPKGQRGPHPQKPECFSDRIAHDTANRKIRLSWKKNKAGSYKTTGRGACQLLPDVATILLDNVLIPKDHPDYAKVE